MIDEKANRANSFSFSATSEDWEKLVRVVDRIDRKSIIDLVKHDKHLLQHDFRGFRPDHLLWDRVPRVIAQHAQNCNLTRTFLLKSWLAANEDLCVRVKDSVSASSIEDDVATLLATMDCTERSRDSLLWALILDEREEIKAALTEDFHKSLSQASSALSLKAEVYMLKAKLEEAQEEIKSAHRERDTFKTTAAQVPGINSTIEKLHQQIDQMEREHISVLTYWQTVLENTKEEKENISKELGQTKQEKGELQAQLEGEHLQQEKLLSDFNTLRSSLDVILASQLEKTEAVKRQLGETLDLLEKERKLIALYNQDAQIRIPLSELYRAWDEAVEQIAHHISLTLSKTETDHVPISSGEHWKDWLHWQQQEETLLRPLLSSLSVAAGGETQDLQRVDSAQKLLMVRWYLLEWFKLAVLDMLRADSRVMVEEKEKVK